jgi:hypothetical protein
MATNPERPKTQLDGHLASKCDLCGASEWALPPDTYALIAHEPGGGIDVRGARALSLRAIVCKSCGVVRLLDAEVGH